MSQKLSNLQSLLTLYNRRDTLEKEIKRLAANKKADADKLRDELKEVKIMIRMFEDYLLNS